MTQCFWLEPTDRVNFYLARDTFHSGLHCPGRGNGEHHFARSAIEILTLPRDAEFDSRGHLWPSYDDPRWPTRCEACEYVFGPDDDCGHSSSCERIYVRTDTGKETTIREAGPGAMWDATWMNFGPTGPDGRRLSVATPGGEWFVDGQASNCTIPEDRHQLMHHCWVRHGDPTSIPPTVTVDKNGPTCNAGAGSIQCGSYHGFLQNGVLT